MTWKEVLIVFVNRIVNLLSVKSLVTIALTVVFAVQVCRGQVNQSFLTVYTMIISFYFGTQSWKSGSQTAEDSALQQKTAATSEDKRKPQA